MSGFDPGRIVALDAPVMCLDTCTVLDLMRDPTREDMRVNDRRAGLALLALAEGETDLVVLVAEQATHEFGEHAKAVQNETEKAIKKLEDQLRRIDELAALYGTVGKASLV